MSQQQFERVQPPGDSPTNHPDYARLAEILSTGIGAEIEASEGTFDLTEYAKQWIDPQSVAFISMQRIIGAGLIPANNPEEIARHQEALLAISYVFLEAFVLGIQWSQADKSNDEVLGGVLRKLILSRSGEQWFGLAPDLFSIENATSITPLEHAVLNDEIDGLD